MSSFAGARSTGYRVGVAINELQHRIVDCLDPMADTCERVKDALSALDVLREIIEHDLLLLHLVEQEKDE